jgi:hypothetical protein
VSLTPSTLTATAGNPVTIAVSTATLSGAAQALTLALTNAPPPNPMNLGFNAIASSGITQQPSQPAFTGSMPPGFTWSFSPASINSGQSSTLTITIAAGTPAQMYTLQVVATGSTGIVHTDALTLTVVAGTASQDFSV